MPRIALAGCRLTATSPPDELFPDDDSLALRDELRRRGCEAELLSWDDPAVDWARWDRVVLRSTWDSVDRPDEFLGWADARPNLANPAPVVRWNLDKRYLRDLEEEGIAVVPTTWVEPGRTWAAPGPDFVVKPAISAGSRDTTRYDDGSAAAAPAHVDALHARGQTVLVQPYLRSVEAPGEISLVAFDGGYHHAVRKGGFLDAGAPVPERPWERMVFLGPTEPTAAERELAAQVLGTIERRFGQRLLYARVDLVADDAGRPVVLEVELIDPNLSLLGTPAAVPAFADAVLGR